VISLKDNPDLIRLMSPEDQRTYGPGIQPSLDNHPQPKMDRQERAEQKQFANYCLLNQYPFSWHATHTRSKATPGTPDFWVGVNGMSLWIEFKRDHTQTLSEAQEDFGQKLARQRMTLYVVYSAAEATELVKLFQAPTVGKHA
jgi:hypothetical protein